jgi:hypothetical protein
MARQRDPWPLAPHHQPTGYCILPGHGPEPFPLLMIMPVPGVDRLMACPMHDGDVLDRTVNNPGNNRPMCALRRDCRLRHGHRDKCIPLAREMRR